MNEVSKNRTCCHSPQPKTWMIEAKKSDLGICHYCLRCGYWQQVTLQDASHFLD